MTAREIYHVIDANKHNYHVFGIRTCADEYKAGDCCAASYDWTDGIPGEQLDGTCATGFGYLWLYDNADEEDIADDVATIQKALDLHRSISYPGQHMYLIAGNDSEYGNDDAEVIISGAEVVAVIK